jgi:hypothetical protein
MKLKLLSCVLSVAVLAGFAPPQASEEPSVFDRQGNRLPDSQVNSPDVNWQVLSIQGGRALSGVGLVDMGGGGGCTGTFLNTGAGPDGPAYLLSNGHCASRQLPGPRDVIVNRPSRGMNFRFNYFVDAGAAVYTVPIVRIAYATMHGTDVTVFQLAESFGSLVSKGFIPFRIAGRDVDGPTGVEMVGIPQNGVLRAQRFLRLSTCKLASRANVREGGYEWFGSFSHQCSSVGGSSGSPMISLETGEIVAINNTGVNDNAMNDPECSLNRPCEVAPDGSVRTMVNFNYAERTSDITTCFDALGVFNLALPGCRLERPL